MHERGGSASGVLADLLVGHTDTNVCGYPDIACVDSLRYVSHLCELYIGCLCFVSHV